MKNGEKSLYKSLEFVDFSRVFEFYNRLSKFKSEGERCMITSEKKREIMEKTIDIAKESISERGNLSPKVGAILTDNEGKILLTCFRGETGVGNHCEYGLLEKANQANLDLTETVLFVTLEPCVSRGTGKIPCAQRIVESGIKAVYIGTLDPNPIIMGKGEMFLREKKIAVERYPNDLVEILREVNKDFFELFVSDYLPNDSLFMQKNVPQIVSEYLKEKGYCIERKLPDNWNLNFDYLSVYCYSIEKDKKKLQDIMNNALGYAYDKKYVSRDYKWDVRGEYNQWTVAFNNILQELNIGSLNYLRTLVVGIGNGHEGKYLYSDIEDLTIVDIAPKSLEKAKEVLHPKNAFVMNAQDLYEIESSSMEAYISLMTYQSTYFDIDKALVEAYRVLKSDGIIILSVACGFMKKAHVYIDGIINPQNGSVDRNRPYDIIDIIRRKLISFNYVSLGIRTTPSEIYIYARKSK